MNIPPLDFSYIISWWFLLFLIGLCYLPLTIRLFASFTDKGYIFSKIIGILLLSYTAFISGIIHLLPFTRLNTEILLIIWAFIIYGIYLYRTKSNLLQKIKKRKLIITVVLFEELLFFASLFVWSLVRGYEPDIHGLEKYMDFGFMNSILRSSYFPPQDIWFPPFSINYYYFGHLVTALLTQLSNISPFITFNLMVATIFAFTTVPAFSITLTMLTKFSPMKKVILKNMHLTFSSTPYGKIPGAVAFLGSILTAVLLSLGGNLHTIYIFFKPYATDNPVPFWELPFSSDIISNSYWYPNATRFIYNTIHEFPIYSFVVSDLHGHVLDIPFVLLIIALFVSITLHSTRLKIAFIPLLLSVLYMTNASDGIIYFLFAALLLLCLEYKKIYIDKKRTFLFVSPFYKKYLNKIASVPLNLFFFNMAVYAVILGGGYFILSLPFNYFFKPFISGIGILCAPSFLTTLGHIGPFLFEPNHCQHSYWWELLTLYGFFYFWLISYGIMVVIRYYRVKKLSIGDFFIFLTGFIATVLIIIPEFIYFKDIYPAHYRANTMFKLVYQSFILLSLISGYCIVQLFSAVIKFRRISPRTIATKVLLLPWVAVAFFLLFLVLIYPYFAIKSYYADLKTFQGLNGFSYFKTSYPSDYEAILWINTHIGDQPVMLEAQGDSYTDYARVSVNTGLPTVLGWTVHEWLWRKTYDVPAPRIGDVQQLYESQDLQQTKNLLAKYHIEYVFIGNLEREKYPTLYETKFEQLGKLIYNTETTHIYRITQ